MKDLFGFIGVIAIIFFVGKCTFEGSFGSSDSTKRKMEIMYAKRQRDALEGDVRVRQVDTNWIYTKTPWDFDSSGYIPETRIGRRADREYDYQGD